MARSRKTTEQPPEGEAVAKKKERRPSTDFPQHTLEEALPISLTIENANAGQPYPPAETAIALGRSPGSSAYHSLLSSSLRYGLTTGSYKSPKIAVSPLGQAIAAPSSDEERADGLVRAALSPATFRRMYEYYKGKKLPETQYMANTAVREFGVPVSVASECVETFKANMDYVGLVRRASTGPWLSTEATPMPTTEEEQDVQGSEDEGANGQGDPQTVASLAPAAPGTPAPVPEAVRPNAIFVGHGKNRKPLEQLVKILDEYSIPKKVAVDEPNRARPISQKVADTMKECGAAILIFTCDEEFTDADGNTVWRPSENVVYELGAASMLYGKQIIIFKEEGVDFPANFSDIGHISFPKGDLASKGIELIRELIDFKIIKVSVGG